MSKEFEVDEHGLTADGYRILPKDCRKSMYIVNLIKFAMLAAICLIIAHFGRDILGDDYDTACIVMFAIFLIFAAYWIAGPEVFYRRYRYRIDDEKAEIRRGIITISHSMVPIERIHQVEVSKGPVNRMFGLANVVITTAGGVTTLEYLDEDTAESIASKLNECVVRLLKDRD